MDTMLSFSSDNLCDFMNKEDMKAKAPYIFYKTPTNPDLSDRYVMASTETIIDDMEKLGWGVVECRQQRNNKKSTKYSFHMVAFQNKDVYITKEVNGEKVIEGFPRIILTNSHDGCNSFKFMVGFFRLVCSNGLVIATKTFEEISVRHINYTFEELRGIVAKAIESVQENISTMNEMQEKILTDEEKYSLAEKAVQIRKNNDEKVSKEILDDVLTPIRDEDQGNCLWVVFNLLQEKVIRGGYDSVSKNGKRRKARPIKGVARDLDINKRLFEEASSYRYAA